MRRHAATLISAGAASLQVTADGAGIAEPPGAFFKRHQRQQCSPSRLATAKLARRRCEATSSEERFGACRVVSGRSLIFFAVSFFWRNHTEIRFGNAPLNVAHVVKVVTVFAKLKCPRVNPGFIDGDGAHDAHVNSEQNTPDHARPDRPPRRALKVVEQIERTDHQDEDQLMNAHLPQQPQVQCWPTSGSLRG